MLLLRIAAAGSFSLLARIGLGIARAFGTARGSRLALGLMAFKGARIDLHRANAPLGTGIVLNGTAQARLGHQQCVTRLTARHIDFFLFQLRGFGLCQSAVSNGH